MCNSTAGPLDKYLKQHTELVQRKDILLYVATQICSAMKWLEAKGIAHGDLVSSFIEICEGRIMLGKPEYRSNETNQMLVTFMMLLIQMSGGVLACNLQLMHAF